MQPLPLLAALASVLAGSVLAGPDRKTIDGVAYLVLRAPPDCVRIVWKDAHGKPLRTFPEVARYLASENFVVDTLMNGGIYEEGGLPSGLLVQDGRVLRPVNRSDGRGNFFLKPNGIFLIGAGGAAVIQTEEYAPKEVDVRCAVQSGPLLLRQGKPHPRFDARSESRLHRNGVGVSDDGEVVFVMSEIDSPKFPNLYEFAEVFRTLGCRDALFLDGDLSQMRSGEEITKQSNHFGSIIAVSKTRNTGQSTGLNASPHIGQP